MHRLPLFLAAAALAGALASASTGSAEPMTAAANYDGDGKMLLPADYREWVFLSSGRGMAYGPVAQNRPEPPYDNVFVNPAAYHAFLDTGHWPDGTVLVLEIRGGTGHGSILQGGSFQTGDALGVEVHVKDTARFGGDGWAFFGFGNDQASEPMIAHEANCYACHAANTAVDTTFVQFYPTLLPTARAKGTITPAYLAGEAAEAH